MNAILEAARLQGDAEITRKALACSGKKKVHLWELASGEVIMLRHVQGEGFKQPVKLQGPMEIVVDRFREKRGHRVISAQVI